MKKDIKFSTHLQRRYSPGKYAATLQEQPAYQGEANAVCVNKRPQGRNGYGGWKPEKKKPSGCCNSRTARRVSENTDCNCV